MKSGSVNINCASDVLISRGAGVVGGSDTVSKYGSASDPKKNKVLIIVL